MVPHRRMLLQAGADSLRSGRCCSSFVLTRSLPLIMTALVVYSLLRTCADVNMLPLFMRPSRAWTSARPRSAIHEHGEHARGRAGRVCGRVSKVGLRPGWRVRRGGRNPCAGRRCCCSPATIFFFLLRKDLRASGGPFHNAPIKAMAKPGKSRHGPQVLSAGAFHVSPHRPLFRQLMEPHRRRPTDSRGCAGPCGRKVA